MSIKSNLVTTITECLEHGHHPDKIAEILDVPVKWVHEIESQLVAAVDAGAYDEDVEYVDHLVYGR